MNQLERNRSILAKYIPEPAIDIIAEWIYKFNFKLKVKKSRSSKEGDYMSPHDGRNHVITINHDLNKYAFLITLIHEIAHLTTWEKYKGRVNPHGSEWKSEYSRLLNHFLKLHFPPPEGEREPLFPKEIFLALQKHMQSPSAASGSDINLSRVLKKYDTDTETLLLERISMGSSFRIVSAIKKHSTEVFIKGEKRRTRFKCIHARTKREYLIHALCKVAVVTE
ncbi:MAG: SprT-like domain-containing protein [Bacteroidetes bacterium]|nr:SprT-like domain-containing protein [Bacteroidota bacterium]